MKAIIDRLIEKHFEHKCKEYKQTTTKDSYKHILKVEFIINETMEAHGIYMFVQEMNSMIRSNDESLANWHIDEIVNRYRSGTCRIRLLFQWKRDDVHLNEKGEIS